MGGLILNIVLGRYSRPILGVRLNPKSCRGCEIWQSSCLSGVLKAVVSTPRKQVLTGSLLSLVNVSTYQYMSGLIHMSVTGGPHLQDPPGLEEYGASLKVEYSDVDDPEWNSSHKSAALESSQDIMDSFVTASRVVHEAILRSPA